MKKKLIQLLRKKGMFDILSYVHECDKLLAEFKTEIDSLKAANEKSANRKIAKNTPKVPNQTTEDVPRPPIKVLELLNSVYPQPVIEITFNDKRSGIVTNIQAIHQELFNIIDSTQFHLMPIIGGQLKAFTTIPHVGSLLVLDTAKGRFRAMCVPKQGKEGTLSMLFLDTGEIVHVKDNIGFYEMPEECRLIPSLALLCKLIEVSFNNYA